MTEIKELLEKINKNPENLDKINWREELRGFEVNRIASIIIGIEDDYVCKQVARIIEVTDYPEYFEKEHDARTMKRATGAFYLIIWNFSNGLGCATKCP